MSGWGWVRWEMEWDREAVDPGSTGMHQDPIPIPFTSPPSYSLSYSLLGPVPKVLEQWGQMLAYTTALAEELQLGLGC